MSLIRFGKLILFVGLFHVFTGFSYANHIKVTPEQNLQKVLDEAQPNDIIALLPGEYSGNFMIAKPITLMGKGAVLNGLGKGNVLNISSDHVTIKHLSITNWGDDLTEQNAGIFVNNNADYLTIRDNHLSGTGFGMWLQKTNQLKVLNNTVVGNDSIRSSDRGNGIQLSSVKGAIVEGNDVSKTRDGLYIISSQDNLIKNNVIHDLRYGVHYMYSHSNKVIGNRAFNTRAGFALMSSRNLVVEGNSTFDSEDYGFLLNFITSSTIADNQIIRVWTKPENKVLGRDGKGIFVYNSAYNTIKGNLVDTTEIGIHLTAGSENTKVYGNSFINNPTQVKYVSNKKQEWSFEGKGNYWSNYLGWDLDGNEIGDAIFEPNDGIDKLVWQYPEMKMLMDSPAVIMLRWVQRQFPVLKPPGVKDSFPLMSSPLTALEYTKVVTQ